MIKKVLLACADPMAMGPLQSAPASASFLEKNL